MPSPAPPVFLFFAGAGLVGAIWMLAVRRKRGPRAYAMAAAFLAFGILGVGVYLSWASFWLILIGIAMGLMLLVDLVIRQGSQPMEDAK